MKLHSTSFLILVLGLAACGGSQKAPDAATSEAPPASASTETAAPAVAATKETSKEPEAEPAPQGPECKKDEDCTVFADCCTCKAVPASKPSPVPCESVCGESKCEVKGMTIANVACDAGRCVLKKK